MQLQEGTSFAAFPIWSHVTAALCVAFCHLTTNLLPDASTFARLRRNVVAATFLARGDLLDATRFERVRPANAVRVALILPTNVVRPAFIPLADAAGFAFTRLAKAAASAFTRLAKLSTLELLNE